MAGTSDVYWPLSDNLGTVRDVAEFDEATGITSIANHLTYGAFGQVASETDAAIEHLFGFTGRERDEESGLAYYRARYYDPQLGQFISEDPIGFEAGDANLRRYVGNNATNATDPSGLQELSGESLAQQRRQLKAKVGAWIQFGASPKDRSEFLDGLKEGFLDGLKDWLAIATLVGDAAIVTEDKVNWFSLAERVTGYELPWRDSHRESVRAAERRMVERLYALEQLGVELSQVREVTALMLPVAAEVLSIVGANLPLSMRVGALATFDRGKSTAQLAAQAEQIIDQASPLLVQIASATADAGPRALGYIAGAVLYEVTETVVIGAVTGPAGAAARGTVSLAKIALKVAQKYPKIGNLASTVIKAGKIVDASPVDEATRLASRDPTRLFGHNEYVVADAAHAARVRQGLEAYYRQHAPRGATIRWVDNLPGGRNGYLDTVTGDIRLSNDLLTPQYRHLAEGVLVEELQHFHQLQSRGWIGRNLTAAENALIEQEVVQRIQRSGFRIFDPRRP